MTLVTHKRPFGHTGISTLMQEILAGCEHKSVPGYNTGIPLL
ncbi:MAG: hypothetical protein SVW57_08935 [Thermodesulfobacteriota bacterium]|nr:hypothetical protein [Thermodesulfobacteriota bacterium]